MKGDGRDGGCGGNGERERERGESVRRPMNTVCERVHVGK